MNLQTRTNVWQSYFIYTSSSVTDDCEFWANMISDRNTIWRGGLNVMWARRYETLKNCRITSIECVYPEESIRTYLSATYSHLYDTARVPAKWRSWTSPFYMHHVFRSRGTCQPTNHMPRPGASFKNRTLYSLKQAQLPPDFLNRTAQRSPNQLGVVVRSLRAYTHSLHVKISSPWKGDGSMIIFMGVSLPGDDQILMGCLTQEM